eukprot:750260-Hanusia_phi.AAC.4
MPPTTSGSSWLFRNSANSSPSLIKASLFASAPSNRFFILAISCGLMSLSRMPEGSKISCPSLNSGICGRLWNIIALHSFHVTKPSSSVSYSLYASSARSWGTVAVQSFPYMNAFLSGRICFRSEMFQVSHPPHSFSALQTSKFASLNSRTNSDLLNLPSPSKSLAKKYALHARGQGLMQAGDR